MPVRVEYNLTELGRTTCDPVHAIHDWAEKHAGELRAARQRYDRPEAPAAVFRPRLIPWPLRTIHIAGGSGRGVRR